MKPSPDLFNLIKSLSKNEKIYFKKFSALHVIGNENSYIPLFNEIDRQSYYDEKKILESYFRHNKNVSKNTFAVAKNYLFDHLLIALESYHYSVRTEISGLIHRAEILHEKGLNKLALKSIRRAKEKAGKYEEFILLCVIIKFEEELLITIIKTTEEFNYFEKLNKAHDSCLQEIKILSELETIYNKLLMYYKIYGRPRSKKIFNQLNTLFKFVKGFKKVNSVKSRILIQKILSYYSYYIKNDLLTSIKHYQQLHTLILSNKDLIQCNPGIYLDFYLQSTYPKIDLGWFDEALANTEEIKKLSSILIKTTPAWDAKFFNISHLLKCEIYIQSGRYSEGISMIDDMAKELERHKKYLNKTHEIYYYYNFAYICFGSGNYRLALKWMNKYLNEDEVEIRLDRQAFARILYLLIHYELGNFEILDSLFRHTSGFYRNKKFLFKTEERILDFIKSKLITKLNKTELIYEMKKLQKDLNLIIKDTLEKNSLEFFDYLSWLKSKIEKKSFAEIVRNKKGTKKV